MLIPVLAFSFGWPLLGGTVLSFAGFSYYYMTKNISHLFLMPVFMLFVFSVFLISYKFENDDIKNLLKNNYISGCAAAVASGRKTVSVRELKSIESACKNIKY